MKNRITAIVTLLVLLHFSTPQKRSVRPIVIEDTAKQCGLGEMPSSIVIDREGRIADSHLGVVDPSAGESEIQRLLNERK